MSYLLIYLSIGIVVDVFSLLRMITRRQDKIAKLLNEMATLKRMPNDRWPVAAEGYWNLEGLTKGLLLSLIAWPYLVYRDWK